ncbi:MAG: hypothetical protein JWM15_3873 [Cryptosporangiaceae bacterium]|nr:hypothetical protein [Cryptosporangiaceae bacterium]
MTDPTDLGADELDAALARAFEAARAHLTAVRGGADDEVVEAAYRVFNNASAAYDELLFETYDEVTPWQVDTLDDTDFAESELSGDGMTIAVRQRRDYLVPDVSALIAAGTAARRAQGLTGNHEVEGIETDHEVTEVGEAVYELLQAAGGSMSGLDVPELEARNGVLMVNSVALPLEFGDDPGPGEADLPFVCVPDSRMLLRIDEEMISDDGDEAEDDTDGT